MIVGNISLEEFLEILNKWSGREKNCLPDNLKPLFEITKEGIDDAKKWFEIAKENDNILITVRRKDNKIAGIGWAVVESFWNGGKQLIIEVLYGEDEEVIRYILKEIMEFGKKKNVKIIYTVYICLDDKIIKKILEENGFVPAFVDFVKVL